MNIRLCDICKERIPNVSGVSILKIDKHPDDREVTLGFCREICTGCSLGIKLYIKEKTIADVTITPIKP